MLQQLADQKTQERKLEEELLRKKGDLISTHSKRDDTYQGLVREKEILRRDQEVLTDIERVLYPFQSFLYLVIETVL